MNIEALISKAAGEAVKALYGMGFCDVKFYGKKKDIRQQENQTKDNEVSSY